MCRGSSLLNGVTPIVPPVRLSPHPRTKLLDGDWPPVVRRPRPSGARPAYRQAPSGRIRFSARGVAARAGEKLLRREQNDCHIHFGCCVRFVPYSVN